LNSFQKLKTTLNSVSGKIRIKINQNKIFSLDLQDIDSITFLTPFLDIIRSDETSGPITCLALNAVNKFLSYGLIGRIKNK
jgi:brefeldin A-resistance guanine nucleotide exchange factor 1